MSVRVERVESPIVAVVVETTGRVVKVDYRSRDVTLEMIPKEGR